MTPPSSHRINHWSRALRDEFGGRVQRVVLDAGLSCPNRDGTRATGGCIFCDAAGSLAPHGQPELSIREQLARGIAHMRRRYGANCFIAYLQPHTNTHASLERLRAIFAEALEPSEVVGLAIGTRADCLPNDVLDHLCEINLRRRIWLEIGLQSSNESTLRWMNRAHGVEEWIDAVQRAKTRGLYVATHLILGLPDEGREDWLRSIDHINRLGIDGLKFHMLYVDAHAPLAVVHRRTPLPLMTREAYVSAVCDLLEHLDSRVQIMRLVSECSNDRLLAPQWLKDKRITLDAIEDMLTSKNSCQGYKAGISGDKSHLPALD